MFPLCENVHIIVWYTYVYTKRKVSTLQHVMKTSSNGNIFRVTGSLCGSPVTGEFPSQRAVTRRFDVFLICVWINGWVNNREAGDLGRSRVHYDVTVMWPMKDLSAWGYLTHLYVFLLYISIVFLRGLECKHNHTQKHNRCDKREILPGFKYLSSTHWLLSYRNHEKMIWHCPKNKVILCTILLLFAFSRWSS